MLSRNLVQKIVKRDLQKIASKIKPNEHINRVVTVQGKKLQYTAYKLSNGKISIGRINEIK